MTKPPGPKEAQRAAMRIARHEANETKKTASGNVMDALIETIGANRMLEHMSTLAELRAQIAAKPKSQKVAEAKQAVEAVANAMANSAVDASAKSTYKYRDPEARKAYQRDLMRKRRAGKSD